MSQKIENNRSRTWDLVLYPSEDPTHQRALDYIQFHYSSYAFINHDKDIDENGEIKKNHTHVVIQFKNQKWRNSLALELGITPNYMQKCEKIDKSLEYLIHLNNEEKYQYDIKEVQGTLKSRLERLILNKDKSEEEIVIELLTYIRSQNHIRLTDFVRYVCEKGLYSYYRRSQSTFKIIIEEHNYEIYQEKRHY